MRSGDRFIGTVVFLFALALLSWERGDHAQALAEAPQSGLRAAYFPNVTLKTQDNKDVRFYEDLIKGKIVLINFMYTRCEGRL